VRRIVLTTAAVLSVTGLSGCATAGAVAAPAATKGAFTQGKATPARPTSAMPAVASTGTNLLTVIPSITGYAQWLLANPDPALVPAIAVPGCGSFNALVAEARSLVGQGAYVKTAKPVFTSIRSVATGSRATVEVQVSRAAEPVLDRRATKTRVLSTLPRLSSTAMRITLIRGADTRWRLCDITDENGDEATTRLF